MESLDILKKFLKSFGKRLFHAPWVYKTMEKIA